MTAHKISLVLLIALLSGCNSPQTPEDKLARALQSGNLRTVKKLVEEGTDVTQTFGEEHSTALHLLAESINPDPELAAFLVEQGVDINAENDAGKTAWDIGWEGSQPIRDRQGQFLSELLKASYEPELTSETEGTPFFHTVATRCHSALLVKLLGEMGGTEAIEARDENGWTALHHAAFDGNYESADGLLIAGADPNAETTKEILSSYDNEGQYVVVFRYEAGSRPMDLYHKTFTRGTKDFKELLVKHGGSGNAGVENVFQ